MNEPILHHYVPRSVLRRFSLNDTINVYDKIHGRHWSNSIGNTGAEKHFYRVVIGDVVKNFEYDFGDVDHRYYLVVNKLAAASNIKELSDSELAELCDVLAIQFLRTNTIRLTIKTQMEQLKKAVSSFGFQIDDNSSEFKLSKEQIV